MTTSPPDGLWIRCGHPDLETIANSLKERLLADGDPLRIKITGGSNSPRNPRGERRTIDLWNELGSGGILWLGGRLDLASIDLCRRHDRSVCAAAIEAEDVPKAPRASLILRNRGRIKYLSYAMATDDETKEALLRRGLSEHRIEVVGKLTPDTGVLPYDESERARLALAMKSRPSWLAAGCTTTEVKALAQAHREATRTAHRLLLMVVPLDPVDDVVEALRSEDLQVASQRDGQEPDENAQVFVADGMEELGLFLRLSPISFICGTFEKGTSIDPYQAAALGSALIAGPAQKPYFQKFMELLKAGSVMQLEISSELGAAVNQLLSAERAARMAQAGWEVSTDGVVALGRVENMVRTRLLGQGPLL